MAQHVRNTRAAALGLTVTVGYDFDGDMYEIRLDGVVIDTCIDLTGWLDRYAKHQQAQPFNLALHSHLTALGYVRTRHPEYWEDTGDAESGPDLDGYQEHDAYVGDDDMFVVFADGTIDHDSNARSES